MPQSTVFTNQAFGVIGEFYKSSPKRCDPYILDTTDPTNNVIGRAFSVKADGFVQAGNPASNKPFAGFLVNPKAYTTSGTALGGSLAPTLTLPNETVVEIANMGELIVTLPSGGNVGDSVIYDVLTGALDVVAPGDLLPDGFLFAQAEVFLFSVDSGLAVIRITTVPVAPASA